MSYFSNIRSSKPLKYDFDLKDERQRIVSDTMSIFNVMPSNVRFWVIDRGERDEEGFYKYDLDLEEFRFFPEDEELVNKRLIESTFQLLKDNESKGEVLIIETSWNYMYDTDNFVYIDGTYDELSPELLRSFFQMEDFDHKKLTIRY